MPFIMDHQRSASTRGAKVRWLQAHCFLWENSPPDDRQNWRDIIKLMKVDGLVAPTTYPFDVNVPSLIAEAGPSQ
jgi:hypothetical protein